MQLSIYKASAAKKKQTVKIFDYDMKKVQYKLMSGSHMEHAGQFDEEGKNLLGKLICEFITSSIK